MTLNTKVSIWVLLATVGLYLAGPLAFILFGAYVSFYAIIASLFGEEVLQTTEGYVYTTTPLGYTLIGIFLFIALLPILLCIYSIIVDQVTKGRRTPLISTLQALRRRSRAIATITLITVIFMVLVSIWSFATVTIEHDDVNIGAGILLMYGLAAIATSTIFITIQSIRRSKRTKKMK